MQMSHKNEKKLIFLVPKKSLTKFSEIMDELGKRFINFNSDLWNEEEEEVEAADREVKKEQTFSPQCLANNSGTQTKWQNG